MCVPPRCGAARHLPCTPPACTIADALVGWSPPLLLSFGSAGFVGVHAFVFGHAAV